MDINEKLAPIPLQLTAVLSGVVISLSFLYLCMSFAAALGLWSFQYEDLPLVGWPFWMMAILSWTLSSSLGAWVSVWGSPGQGRRTAIFQALTVWAGGYLVFGGLTVTISDLLTTMSPTMNMERLLWAGFLGDFISLVSAIGSGIWAFQRSSKSQKTESRSPQESQLIPAAT